MLDWITENTVVEWKHSETDEEGYIERILWVDPRRDIVVTIAMNDDKAMPLVRTFDEYTSNLIDRKHKVIEWTDSNILLLPDESIPEKHKQIRDKAWHIIGPLVTEEPDIYDPKMRGLLVSEVVKNHGIHKSTVYRYLRRYWQGGKIVNTLLPYYDNCGGKGKEREAGMNKRGRPRKFAEEDVGINIDDEVKRLFRTGIRLFYNTKEKAPLKRAYQKTLEKFFYIGYQQDGDAVIPILPPKEKLPTFGQFKYWFTKELDLKETLSKRYGKKNYELKFRPSLGSSTYESFGPGSRFQIDATIADVFLVSEYKREWIIGRPVVYVVIDVFSRMITGLYVGLEGPSWLGAMMALANTTADKVKFCTEYGIHIEPDEWICSHLPQKLTADRGELEGNKPSNLISALGVDVETEPPYRADWKGIVEQQFRLLNLRSVKWVPGAVQSRMKEREGTIGWTQH
ncbi:helix-turn-helix domain-containing protein [Effusibacillus lacus]|uniref:Transposase n=1 Tax=Effusibacillus lacus TaxID=1348429 RepID=A0A292YIX5_9BACL|nr:helix-turn-helix domain-containing protein [Effusibacillus lacus]TCS68538.1 integrase-like protein [Effusibacillus lacus]GAX88420.1 transposase [Effusibacillus lacus]